MLKKHVKHSVFAPATRIRRTQVMAFALSLSFFACSLAAALAKTSSLRLSAFSLAALALDSLVSFVFFVFFVDFFFFLLAEELEEDDDEESLEDLLHIQALTFGPSLS